MGRRVVLSDDLTGEESTDHNKVATYTFSWAGQDYEIDLSEKSADGLEKSLVKYILKARQITKLRARAITNPDRVQAMREWAKAQGMEVAERGRISTEVIEAYTKAHETTVEEPTSGEGEGEGDTNPPAAA